MKEVCVFLIGVVFFVVGLAGMSDSQNHPWRLVFCIILTILSVLCMLLRAEISTLISEWNRRAEMTRHNHRVIERRARTAAREQGKRNRQEKQ